MINNAINSSSPIQVSMGGTNTTAFSNTDGVVYYDGTSLNTTTVGTSTYILTSNGSGFPPSFKVPSSGGFTWTDVTGTSQAVAVSNGYFANNASPVSMYLPSFAPLGSEVKFSNKGTGGFLVVPAGGQTINFLNQSATYPSYFSTSSIYAAMHLACETGDTAWNVINHEGSFAVVSVPLEQISFIGQGNAQASALILKSNGTLWTSGYNGSGQLGNLTTTSYSSPIAVVGSHLFSSIAGGGALHSVALKLDGSLWTWGYNNHGQLGDLTTAVASSPISVVGNHSFIKITCGVYSTHALKADGSAWGFGWNSTGQLGDLTNTDTSSPISVVGAHSFIDIVSGEQAVYGLKSNGEIWAWGYGLDGALGDGTTAIKSSPVLVIGNHSFIKIAAAATTGCGLKIDGSTWCWGVNLLGEMGDGTATNKSSPVAVIGNHSFIEITAAHGNGGSVYGLKSNGEIWAWGENSSGQLGDQTIDVKSSPILVIGGFSFIQLMKNGSSANGAGVLSNGQIWAWGSNDSGALANNTNTNSSSPVLVLNTP